MDVLWKCHGRLLPKPYNYLWNALYRWKDRYEKSFKNKRKIFKPRWNWKHCRVSNISNFGVGSFVIGMDPNILISTEFGITTANFFPKVRRNTCCLLKSNEN